MQGDRTISPGHRAHAAVALGTISFRRADDSNEVGTLHRHRFCHFIAAHKQCMAAASSPAELGKVRCDVAIVRDRHHLPFDLVGNGIHGDRMAPRESVHVADATPAHNFRSLRRSGSLLRLNHSADIVASFGEKDDRSIVVDGESCATQLGNLSR